MIFTIIWTQFAKWLCLWASSEADCEYPIRIETRREKNEIWIHEGVRADASVLPVSEVFVKAANLSKCKISLYDFVWPGADIEKE